jgi:hypothetical protein
MVDHLLALRLAHRRGQGNRTGRPQVLFHARMIAARFERP